MARPNRRQGDQQLNPQGPGVSSTSRPFDRNFFVQRPRIYTDRQPNLGGILGRAAQSAANFLYQDAERDVQSGRDFGAANFEQITAEREGLQKSMAQAVARGELDEAHNPYVLAGISESVASRMASQYRTEAEIALRNNATKAFEVDGDGNPIAADSDASIRSSVAESLFKKLGESNPQMAQDGLLRRQFAQIRAKADTQLDDISATLRDDVTRQVARDQKMEALSNMIVQGASSEEISTAFDQLRLEGFRDPNKLSIAILEASAARVKSTDGDEAALDLVVKHAKTRIGTTTFDRGMSGDQFYDMVERLKFSQERSLIKERREKATRQDAAITNFVSGEDSPMWGLRAATTTEELEERREQLVASLRTNPDALLGESGREFIADALSEIDSVFSRTQNRLEGTERVDEAQVTLDIQKAIRDGEYERAKDLIENDVNDPRTFSQLNALLDQAANGRSALMEDTAIKADLESITGFAQLFTTQDEEQDTQLFDFAVKASRDLTDEFAERLADKSPEERKEMLPEIRRELAERREAIRDEMRTMAEPWLESGVEIDKAILDGRDPMSVLETYRPKLSDGQFQKRRAEISKRIRGTEKAKLDIVSKVQAKLVEASFDTSRIPPGTDLNNHWMVKRGIARVAKSDNGMGGVVNGDTTYRLVATEKTSEFFEGMSNRALKAVDERIRLSASNSSPLEKRLANVSANAPEIAGAMLKQIEAGGEDFDPQEPAEGEERIEPISGGNARPLIDSLDGIEPQDWAHPSQRSLTTFRPPASPRDPVWNLRLDQFINRGNPVFGLGRNSRSRSQVLQTLRGWKAGGQEVFSGEILSPARPERFNDPRLLNYALVTMDSQNSSRTADFAKAADKSTREFVREATKDSTDTPEAFNTVLVSRRFLGIPYEDVLAGSFEGVPLTDPARIPWHVTPLFESEADLDGLIAEPTKLRKLMNTLGLSNSNGRAIQEQGLVREFIAYQKRAIARRN